MSKRGPQLIFADSGSSTASGTQVTFFAQGLSAPANVVGDSIVVRQTLKGVAGKFHDLEKYAASLSIQCMYRDGNQFIYPTNGRVQDALMGCLQSDDLNAGTGNASGKGTFDANGDLVLYWRFDFTSLKLMDQRLCAFPIAELKTLQIAPSFTAGNTGATDYVDLTNVRFDCLVYGYERKEIKWGLRPQVWSQALNSGSTTNMTIPTSGMPVFAFLIAPVGANVGDYIKKGFQLQFDGDIVINNTTGTTVEEYSNLIGEQVYRSAAQLNAALAIEDPTAGWSYAGELGKPSFMARLYRQPAEADAGDLAVVGNIALVVTSPVSGIEGVNCVWFSVLPNPDDAVSARRASLGLPPMATARDAKGTNTADTPNRNLPAVSTNV